MSIYCCLLAFRITFVPISIAFLVEKIKIPRAPLDGARESLDGGLHSL